MPQVAIPLRLLEGLSEEQQAAVLAAGKIVRIVACAGAGKTETLARRILRFLSEGTPPERMAAFTFTDKAAAELKERVYRRALHFLGTPAPAARLFVGTFHAYCLQWLGDPCLEVLEEHRERALIFRAAGELGIFRLPERRQEPAETCRQFLRAVNVVYNERIERTRVRPAPFAAALSSYERLQDSLHWISFGRLIERALARPPPPLAHVFVDEAQDINPQQAELVRRLAAGGAALTLVGDTHQSIYAWRGADPSCFDSFGGELYVLSENRRSRPGIVRVASRHGSLMRSRRPEAPSVFLHHGEDEAGWMVQRMRSLREQGYRWGDMAVLFRSLRTSAAPFLAAFAREGIPYDVVGPSGLFRRPEVRELARILAWIADEPLRLDPRGQTLRPRFDGALESVREAVRAGRFSGLTPLLHAILRITGFPQDPVAAANVGRFNELLADFECAARRVDESGRSPWLPWDRLLRRLVWFINGYGNESYEERSAGADRDTVHVSSVHQAKGLEWPIVFVPCLVDSRFPSSLTGRRQPWLVDRSLFPAGRYEGDERDERRLFYVALTRARDALYLSWFDAPRAKPSRFLVGIRGDEGVPAAPERGSGEPEIAIVPVGDVLLYRQCPHRYRMARVWGFPAPINPALGYGRAVHEILRRAAAEKADPPTVWRIAMRHFYLPYAAGRLRERLRLAAAREAFRYARDHPVALRSVEEAEFRIEFPAHHAVIRGVADAILAGPHGVEVRDYKTFEDARRIAEAALQVRLYAAGLRAQGRLVAQGSLADLSRGRLIPVDVSPGAVRKAVATADAAIAGIRSGRFEASPGPACLRCEFRSLCRFARERATGGRRIPVDPEGLRVESYPGTVPRKILVR